jgi:hypothetical protein
MSYKKPFKKCRSQDELSTIYHELSMKYFFPIHVEFLVIRVYFFYLCKNSSNMRFILKYQSIK